MLLSKNHGGDIVAVDKSNFEKLSDYAETSKKSVDEAANEILSSGLKTLPTLETAKPEFECETVTLTLPKAVCDFYRNRYNEPLADVLAYTVIDLLRAEVESLEPRDIADGAGLTPVFWAYTKDEHYKPENPES